jgi:hypothetical protein
MNRPYWEERRALVVAMVSLVATHSVVAKECSAEKPERLSA